MMLDEIKLITRFGRPTSMDTVDFGTLCHVSNTTESVYYLQNSTNTEMPNWIFIEADTLETAKEKAFQLLAK